MARKWRDRSRHILEPGSPVINDYLGAASVAGLAAFFDFFLAGFFSPSGAAAFAGAAAAGAAAFAGAAAAGAAAAAAGAAGLAASAAYSDVANRPAIRVARTFFNVNPL